jgi:hypothetical protein
MEDRRVGCTAGPVPAVGGRSCGVAAAARFPCPRNGERTFLRFVLGAVDLGTGSFPLQTECSWNIPLEVENGQSL